MASCTQVENLLQAYIDGELSQSERVIVEQHNLECAACRRLLHEQQRTSAFIFETLASDRLRRNLRQSVLENLPEIDKLPVDVEKVNWRVKHPVSFWARVGQVVPVAVVVVLLLVAVVLRYEWPKTVVGDDVIGMVMYSEGQTLRHADDTTRVESAKVADFVQPGDRFETGEGSSMMVTLAGPTQVKLAENTIVKLHEDRWISVLQGHVWLQVSKDERLFRVVPPSGEITVLGTSFDVNVLPDKTRVTVVEGQVHVENDRSVSLLTEGQQVDMVPGAPSLVPREVKVDDVTRWANNILPAAEAQVAYEEHIVPRTQAKYLKAEQVFMLPRNGGSTSVKSIEVQWTPDAHSNGHCNYLVYVTNSKNRLLFKDVIPGDVFDDQDVSSYKILVPEGLIEDFRVLYIRVMPDTSTGRVETSFKNTILAETR